MEGADLQSVPVEDLRVAQGDRDWLAKLDISQTADTSQLRGIAERLFQLLVPLVNASGAELLFMLAAESLSTLNVSASDRPVIEATIMRAMQMLQDGALDERTYQIALDDQGNAIETVRVGGLNDMAFKLVITLPGVQARLQYELNPVDQIEPPAE